MNDRSSRAHTVFILTLTQTKAIPPPTTTTTTGATNSTRDTGGTGTSRTGGGSGGASTAVGEEETITRKSKFFLADLGTYIVYIYILYGCIFTYTVPYCTIHNEQYYTIHIGHNSDIFLLCIGGSEQVKKSLVNEQSGSITTAGTYMRRLPQTQ